jgi:hypothetical protein
MKRTALALAATTALIIVIAPGGATGAGSADKLSCSSINLGGPKIFYKKNMNCKSAKKKARQVYGSGGSNEPRHFDCTSGSNFVDGGDCRHVSKNKYFGWHPAD